MSKKLLNLWLVIMMLAVFVPTTFAAPPAQEGQGYIVVADDWLSKPGPKRTETRRGGEKGRFPGGADQ